MTEPESKADSVRPTVSVVPVSAVHAAQIVPATIANAKMEVRFIVLMKFLLVRIVGAVDG
jgi:hypothetical protein